jgi:hypothetical protein
MKSEEINKRIATACKVIPRYFCHHCWHVVVGKYVTFDERHDERTGGCGRRLEILSPPNYHGDLNAMHEAVSIALEQGSFEACVYRTYLADCSGESTFWNATARQRAEAFLRTIGQWEEIK